MTEPQPKATLEPRICSNCEKCTLHDEGYSIETITGVTVKCQYHPEKEFEDDSPHNEYAKKCELFVQGNPIHYDGDGDPEYGTEIKATLEIQSEMGLIPIPVDGMQGFDLQGEPYKGLRNVNDVPLSDQLKICRAENSWPDWVAYFATHQSAGTPLESLKIRLQIALEVAEWPQTLSDIHREVECRSMGVFVVQEPIHDCAIQDRRTVPEIQLVEDRNECGCCSKFSCDGECGCEKCRQAFADFGYEDD